MTELPRLTVREFQALTDRLNQQNAQARTEPPRKTGRPGPTRTKPSYLKSWQKPCGCDCPGCTSAVSNCQHCLKTSCNRKRNRRTREEFAANVQAVKPAPKGCGCDCAGCETDKHCLVAPCTRKLNRRSAAQIDATGRYDNGRPRDKPGTGKPQGWTMRTPEQIRAAGRYASGRPRPSAEQKRANTDQKRRTRELRTPEQIAADGRYANGRPRPSPRAKRLNAERKIERRGSKPKATRKPKPAPKPKVVVVEADPLAVVRSWFVHATKGTTTLDLPANSQDEAYTVAKRLGAHGWSGGDWGSSPVFYHKEQET